MPVFDFTAFFKQFLYDPKNPLLFNNGFFVFFFGVFIVLYYSFRHNYKVRRYIFCFFSLYFFYKASGWFVILVIISAVVDFLISNAIYRQSEKIEVADAVFIQQNKLRKKLLLIASIIFNLGMLVYFKYTNFFIAVSNDLFSTSFHPLNVILPIGISFYTFENLSYTVDVYRGQFVPAKKFSDYLLFLSFFPKLVMGPIVRAHDFVPQVNEPYVLSEKDFAKGFYLILSGLFKKLIISDFITLNFVNYIFDDPARYTGLENLFAVYGYAAVIYCDFSGYSDIAIGIAKWLGFTIPTNFLSPYQSKNVSEFWRRWHISLSSWLRDYLYIPLGGNKTASLFSYALGALFFVGVVLFGVHLCHFKLSSAILLSAVVLFIFILPAIITKEKKVLATNVNLLNTMLLGGLWHGASWNFIIWGALHGVALAIHKIWVLLTGIKLKKINNTRWYNILSGIITFHFVCFCWIFFKSPDFESGLAMLYQVSHKLNFSVWGAFFANYKAVLGMIAIALVLHLIPDDAADKFLARFTKVPMVAYMIAFFLFVLLYGYFKSAEPVLPIYLQF